MISFSIIAISYKSKQIHSILKFQFGHKTMSHKIEISNGFGGGSCSWCQSFLSLALYILEKRTQFFDRFYNFYAVELLY